MRGLMIVLVIVALAAAGGVSFFTNRLITEVRDKPETPMQAEVPTPPMVAVAAADLAPGATLSDKAVRWQPWPADALRPEYAVVPANADQPEYIKGKILPRFSGKVARAPIAAGQPLTEALVFSRGDAGFLAGTLEPGHRAVAVPVAAESAAAGFIRPGDRVDVLLSQDVRRHVGEEVARQATDIALIRFAAETVIENVRVLAVDQTMAAGEEAAQVVDTATLEVTPEQAEALAVARHMGSISLTLRSLEEPTMMVAESPRSLGIGDAEGGIVEASGLALAIGRQASGTWVGDLEVSPSLAAVVGFGKAPEPEPMPEPEAVVEVEPEPEPWRVTIHRGREPAEVVRGRDDEEDAAAGEDGFDEVYRGGGGAGAGPALNSNRLRDGLSSMSRGAMGVSATRIIGGS